MSAELCSKSNQTYLDLVFFSSSLEQDTSVIITIRFQIEEEIFS